MILVDISSILHRMIFGSTRNTSNFTMIDGKYRTEDYIKLTLHYIISELIDIQIKYNNYGDMVICFDDYKKDYWRRDVYPDYKLNRRVISAKSDNPLNYKEIYEYTNELFIQLRENTPWKCVYVNKAEADDIILILAKEFHKEGILILSPDKDFIQSQRVPGIKQYSALTKKWLVPEHKHDHMEHWIYEHCMLGDASDGVPRVIDHTEFSDDFTKHLKILGKPTEVYEFKKIPKEEKVEVILAYDIHTYNKKGQDLGLDIYKNERFGSSNLEKITSGVWHMKLIEKDLQDKKKILNANAKLEPDKEKKKLIKAEVKVLNEQIKALVPTEKDTNLGEFLDSHPLYREHYDRNFTLVMEEGIPDYMRKNIMLEYSIASTAYNEEDFNEYLDKTGLHTIKSKLPFKSTQKLDITNCGWEF